MESLSNDVLGLILGRVSDGWDRKSCSQVCTLWFTIEAQTRTRVRVHDSRHLRYILPRFPNLTTLVAHNLRIDDPINDEALMFAGEFCPNLRTLDVQSMSCSSASFGDEGLTAAAKGCRRLKKVSLSSINVSHKGIKALQTYAKDLTVLKLLHCDLITNKSLAAIGNMESISDLGLEHCRRITNKGLNLLSSGPASRSLRVLTVCCCDIRATGLRYLRRMSCLEELYLSSHYVLSDDEGVAVSAISSLKKLNLSGRDVSDETLFALARGCRNLVDINLAGCEGITGRGLVSLASCLSLERIVLSSRLIKRKRCKLTSKHIMQIVRGCPSLKHMIVDKRLKKEMSRSHWKKLRDGLCRLEWV